MTLAERRVSSPVTLPTWLDRRRGRAERPMTVALFGQFGVRNFGNEASLRAALDVLRRRPGLEFVAVCDTPSRVADEHEVPATPICPAGVARTGTLRRVLGKVQDARWTFHTVAAVDVVVVPGTGIFEDLWISPGGIPLSLFWLSLAVRVLHRPFLVLSVGADPPADRVSRFLMATTLRAATYLTVRDEHSLRAVASVVGGRRVLVRPDLVFGLPLASGAGSGDPRGVVVGVMDYFGMDGDRDRGDADRRAYVDEVADLIARLHAAALPVTLVAGAAPDRSIVAELVARVAPQGCPDWLEVPHVESLDDVEAAMSSAAVVVASRYHNLVAAFRQGVPAISLGYGTKQQQLMECFGMGAYHQPISGFDAGSVMAQVESVLVERPRWADLIATTLHRLREELAEQDQDLADLIDERQAVDGR
ncbi:polysaccharide pyruvyl transferase family protein [Pengzhenrongella frigida]|uniref:Polysaccharide pyruvyl transferase domain-containing protein n=1 Tax=Pengzhenrongella frigida TaxID=1259133 RepID=A0A4Q5N2E6_9MICO|nr:polysaccharide pyruvyl transferase family protein [Cellulomonas sp. HLT2-17]RYV50757.1 hypothetical protein EUA98_11940 [Cellulomonas sp. HLT2-17]